MVDIRTRSVFDTMRPDLLLVQSRLEEAAKIDYPGVADLILGLLRAACACLAVSSTLTRHPVNTDRTSAPTVTLLPKEDK